MLILELLWWAGWAWFAALVALPLVAMPVLGVVPGFVVWALVAPWSALLGMAALHWMLPRSDPGTHRFPDDRGSVHWALKAWAPSLYLSVFQSTLFTSRFMQRFVLRAFGARLGPGAWLTSRTIVREPHHLRIGANSLVGEYAHLICSYQPRLGILVVADVVIGDDSLVGGYSHLAPGATIGSRCVIEHAVAIGAGTTIGDDSRIGAGTSVYNAVRVGHHVVVGKNCLIPSGSTIADGTRIPDGTVLTPHERPTVELAR